MRAAILLLFAAGCATGPESDLPPWPPGYAPTTARSRSTAPVSAFVGPVQPAPGLRIAWQGATNRLYFIDQQDRTSPNTWIRVASNLTVDAQSNGIWQSFGEGNYRVGIDY